MNKEIENGIIFLVENFFRKNSLYLVGSGISIKYAKTILATKNAIKTSIFNSGSFSAERNKTPSALQKTLIEQPSFMELQEPIPWLYYNCTPNARFENEYLKHILPLIPAECPEYEIFNFCQSGVIFDFNHDGLSGRFIKNKNILIQHPHGKFPPHAAVFLNSLDDLSLDYALKLFDHWEIHPPLKEKEGILSTRSYNFLRNNFNQYDNIFIMGYSFCDDGDDINDIFYLQLISELAAWYKKRVCIINPNFDRLADRLASEIKEIYCYPIKWDIFANVFLNGIGCYPFINFTQSIEVANRLLIDLKNPLNLNNDESGLYLSKIEQIYINKLRADKNEEIFELIDGQEKFLSLELAKLKLLNPALWRYKVGGQLLTAQMASSIEMA